MGCTTLAGKKGNHQTEAKFVKSAKGIVTLEKKDGKTVELSIEKLSDDDQEFINKSKWRLAAPK